jgi:CRISPR-associated protein Csx17
MNQIRLLGCRPEPLLSYLKALGTFRLVAEHEQADPSARAAWADDTLVLHTKLTEDELIQFFIRDYCPTPIVVPWSGDDFFSAQDLTLSKRAKTTPTGPNSIAAIKATTSERFAPYRQTIDAIYTTMRRLGIVRVKSAGSDGKPASAKLSVPGTNLNHEQCKSLLTSNLRAWLPDDAVQWMDVAFALDVSKDKLNFNNLLGNGGGNDGNAHFSDNFMQNLWDVLPDFEQQRAPKSRRLNSTELLKSVLFGIPSPGLALDRTSSLFDSGAVGGANSTQAMLRKSLTNPWNFILGLEGTLCLAGAASRRLNASQSGSSFPFMVVSRAVGTATFAADKDAGQKETWLPLWSRQLGLNEMRLLFSEGRSDVRRKRAKDGIDFARAISTYGTDRGIDAFVRFGIVKGRMGGDIKKDSSTATSLGRFVVQAKPQVDLLTKIDRWLATAQRFCDSDKAIPRFRAALRRLESAIFDYCQFGGHARFAGILQALGAFERELSRNRQKLGVVNSEGRIVPPVPILRKEWISASDDGTPEWRIAMALASIQGVADKLGPLHAHLEPVAVAPKHRQRQWAETSKAVVWNAGSLPQNIAAVLERRMLKAERAGLDAVPLFAQRCARPADVAAFLSGSIDEERLEALLWGAALIDWSKPSISAPASRPGFGWQDFNLLPRPFLLLKVLFMPELGLTTDKGRPILPDAALLAALRADDAGRACELAARRLRVSGHTPLLDGSLQVRGLDATRLAAALLIPLASPPARPNSLSPVAQLVLRQAQPESD